MTASQTVPRARAISVPVEIAIAAALATVALALTAGAAVFGTLANDGDVLSWIPIATAFCLTPAATGLLVVARRPGNRIGWLLLAEGVIAGWAMFSGEYALYGAVEEPGAVPGATWIAALGEASWPLFFAPLVFIAFVMPDGTFLSPKWRRLAQLSASAFVLMPIAILFSDEPLGAPLENVKSPVPDAPAFIEPVRSLLFLGVFAAIVTAAWAVRARFRASEGTARLQLLWFANAALLIPVAIGACVVDVAVSGSAEGPITFIALALVATAIPVSIAIAVLRHGLWDIELVVSRTLVYGTLTVGVLAVYFAVVSGFGAVVGSDGAGALVAVALVAVGIEPLRQRLQRRADHFVYGDRNSPHEALRRLSDRLQKSLAPGEAVQTVVDSVAEALRLPFASLETEDGVLAVHGERGRGEVESLPLVYESEDVGRLVVEVPRGAELAASDRALLRDLAAHAGAAVQATRLTADLQRSRERIITAREEERRRLRRDLHDGLGPDLAAIAMCLDAAQRLDPDGPSAKLLGDVRDTTRGAIAGIRRIVEELRPPALDELGLTGALAEHGTRLAPLHVVVRGPDPAPALPAAIEVAAFRIAIEAITNVARHAHAHECDVAIDVNGALRIEVVDDGTGLPARITPGVGLGSMRERAAEVGGTCTIAPRPGGGTVVHAELPLEQRS